MDGVRLVLPMKGALDVDMEVDKHILIYRPGSFVPVMSVCVSVWLEQI